MQRIVCIGTGIGALLLLTARTMLAQTPGQPMPESPAELLRLHAFSTTLELTDVVNQQVERLGAVDAARQAKVKELLASALRPLEPNYEAPAQDVWKLHAIGMYQGQTFQPDRGLAKVRITHRGAPILLCVSAYESVHWKIELESGVRLKQVILTGYESQTVEGVPDDVSVADYSDQESGRPSIQYCYTRSARGSENQFPVFREQLRELTGLEINTFLEQRPPGRDAQLVLGQANAEWREQRAFAGLLDVYLSATQDLRKQAWNELAELRFPAVYRRAPGPMAAGPKEDLFAATYTVLGPLMEGLTQLNETRAAAIEPRGVRRNNPPLELIDLASGTTTRLAANAEDVPQFSRVHGASYDAKLRRWFLALQMERDAMLYRYDVVEKSWTALRKLERINLEDLRYDPHTESLLALEGHRRPGGFVSLVRFHPEGAIMSRDVVDGLQRRFWPGHHPGVQLAPAEKYLAAIVSAPSHPGIPGGDQQPAEIFVIDRTSTRVIFSTRELEPNTVDGQLEHWKKRARESAVNLVAQLAPEPGDSRPARRVFSEDEAVAPVRNPQNGHFYEVLRVDDITWEQAKELAAKRTFRGLAGHLATVTSAEEDEFLRLNFEAGSIWLGASDAEEEGTWKWVVGPETGQVFWNGDGSGKGEGYQNWDRNETFNEPNNMGDEDFLVWNWPSFGSGRERMKGLWNDMRADRTLSHVIVEFSIPKELETPKQE